MAKRFRKVFIICEDNSVFSHLTQVNIFKYRDSADFACRRLQEKAAEEQGKMWNANMKLPVYKVHAFYLVHEDMFRDWSYPPASNTKSSQVQFLYLVSLRLNRSKNTSLAHRL